MTSFNLLKIIHFRGYLSEVVTNHVPCPGEWARREAKVDQRPGFKLHHRENADITRKILLYYLRVNICEISFQGAGEGYRAQY